MGPKLLLSLAGGHAGVRPALPLRLRPRLGACFCLEQRAAVGPDGATTQRTDCRTRAKLSTAGICPCCCFRLQTRDQRWPQGVSLAQGFRAWHGGGCPNVGPQGSLWPTSKGTPLSPGRPPSERSQRPEAAPAHCLSPGSRREQTGTNTEGYPRPWRRPLVSKTGNVKGHTDVVVSEASILSPATTRQAEIL